MMKNKPVPKLSKRQDELITELVNDAKCFGIQEEYGNGTNVENARANCESSAAALRKEIIRLNSQIKNLKMKKNVTHTWPK